MLDLSDCKSLKSLPAEISNLESLKKLNLSGCSKLKRLPEFSSAGNIEEICGCKRLKSLPSSICKLKSLKVLNLDGCSNIQKLPHELGNLEALNSLYAKGIATTEVPSSVVRLNNKLYELSSDRSRRGDKQMGLLLPITLSIDGLHMTDLRHFDLSGNFKLDRKEVRGIFEDALQDIQLMAAARWKQVREEGYFLEKCGYVIFPGNEIPKWFKFQSVGSSSSITLEMPTPLPGCFSNKNRVLGFTFSAIVAFGEHRAFYLGKVQGRMPRFIPTDPNLVHHVAQLGKAQARMLKLVPIESNQAPHAVHLGKALGRMLRLVPTSLN
ncbi:hypothetical protein CISIN_1g039239mg [Citrus sinensis]|uniref:C-JID domain-containing protein n=1 Tax=Citrus sinensis TaxID=2711 RepID=A0A067DM17_CITSI|nr:hypothetical protein CISIN_1g039239mg [Citrus sinensis]